MGSVKKNASSVNAALGYDYKLNNFAIRKLSFEGIFSSLIKSYARDLSPSLSY